MLFRDKLLGLQLRCEFREIRNIFANETNFSSPRDE